MFRPENKMWRIADTSMMDTTYNAVSVGNEICHPRVENGSIDASNRYITDMASTYFGIVNTLPPRLEAYATHTQGSRGNRHLT